MTDLATGWPCLNAYGRVKVFRKTHCANILRFLHWLRCINLYIYSNWSLKVNSRTDFLHKGQFSQPVGSVVLGRSLKNDSFITLFDNLSLALENTFNRKVRKFRKILAFVSPYFDHSNLSNLLLVL